MYQNKRAAFYTLGCKLNFSETSTISRQLKNKGFIITDFDRVADLYVINTCSVTENANKNCRRIIRNAKETSPNALIIVTGCYAQLKPEELIEKFEDMKLAGLIYTDISRDGMMTGPNIESTLSLCDKTDLPIIASGGVSSLEHIRELSSSSRIYGVICGRALYEEKFTLEEAIKVANQSK